MPEVLTAPVVMTGDQALTDGAVVVGDTTVEWVGPALELPAQYAAAPLSDYPGSTIMPGLIDSHVHLGFDGGRNPAARTRGETNAQQLVLMLHNARDLLGVGVTTARDLGGRVFFPWSLVMPLPRAWPAGRGWWSLRWTGSVPRGTCGW